jgi:hypothetical protein
MRHLRSKLVTAAAILAAAAGGGAIANAATSSSSSSSSGTAPPTGAQAPPANMPAHGTAAHENAEKSVTGSAATKAQSAAVKSVGSGTAGAVTTNFTGHGYEVTVTKSDGSQVEVHLDSSFNVRQGPGPGAPPGGPRQGAPGGPAQGAPDGPSPGA